MQIQALTQAYAAHPQVKALWHAIHATKGPVHLCGMQGSSLSMAFAALFARMSKARKAPLLFVLNDSEEAGYFFHDLHQMLPEGSVLFFPSSFRRDVKYGQRDADNEIMRTEVLTRLQGDTGLCYVVTYPQAMAEMVVTRDTLSHLSLTLRQGEKAELTMVQEMLVELGFTRTDYVYAPGQFAIRGSLVDVYAFNNDNPYRIDFFGDEVDSIRLFSVSDQLSISRLDQVTIVPNLTTSCTRMQCVLDFLSADTLVVSADWKLACDMVEQTYRQGFTAQALAVEAVTEVDEHEARQQLERDMLLVKPEVFRQKAGTFRLLSVRPQPETEARGAVVRFHTHPQPQFNKNFELLFQTLLPYVDQGFSLYILADSEKQNQRLAQIFADHTPSLSFVPVDRTIHSGFLDDDLKAVFLTDHQIFDRFHKFNVSAERARQGRVALTLKELQQFELGDYVVHIDHGIGRFGGLVRIPNGDKMQEVIKIIYKNDDAIFVSIHSLHKIYKYKGREGEQPRINALGTGAWERMKERTKAKIKDIARDLILLYSKRREEKGFAFSPDSYLQHELEASFRYEDTPDQLKATNDVKSDMERARPMDRLVCGDVGFGKTEVAIRAAFKACADGKQVAVMVPTTVLAYQHLNTFKERLRDMPVRIEYLSRARTAAQTKTLLADLAEGRIDIIVGTQKLIGKSVRFKDLGLLIIDEEQKFGVATKERIRQLKPNVDTLTLTATPIPRTLQFSLMGARDLSVIQTPPPNRYPIQTQVCTFSPEIIAEAVNFEMSRGGQVFLVSNRVSSLSELETLIHKYVPDARTVVGHGQMPPGKLEEVVLGFANYDYDVLISTTIIESGIDIPNANTIIVNAAQNFGLSDLHQMRGRVGRSNRKAFCYLLAPPLSVLNVDARRRLQAIENFSDLGSGFHIAMQDLDIRGAGNLLGAEQSGFIADLGYETYQKILSQAVKELRNDEFSELYKEEVRAGERNEGTDFVDECLFETDIQMCFSEQYVPTGSERLMLYRELDGLQSDEQVEAFVRRMEDRFGPIPEEGRELVQVVVLRRLGRYFGSERIMLKRGRMRLYFIANPDSPFYQSQAFDRIIQFANANAHRCRMEESSTRASLLISDVGSVREAVELLKRI